MPDGYDISLHLNLQNDKSAMLTVNIAGVVLTVLMILIMNRFVPITALFDKLEPVDMILRAAVLLVGYIAYIILHELTHAAVMKAVGGGKVRFGFTGMYAYAGSTEDLFDKSAYRLIALAPLVIWGILFIALQLALPASWSWVIYMLQVGNVGGAAGDVYVTIRLAPMPRTLLVKDTGVDMTVYDLAR